MKITVDARPVRYPLAGVGQYVANLCVAIEAQVGSFDVLMPDTNEAADLMTRLSLARQVSRARYSRKPLTFGLRYAPNITSRLAGVSGSGIFHSTYFEGFAQPNRRRALVSTVHDAIFLDHPEWFTDANLKASRWALDRQIDRSAVILTVSEYTKQRVLRHAGRSDLDIRVTPLAVNKPRRRAEVAKLTTLHDKPYVLYLGSLEPRKGIRTLLEAWTRSAARHTHTLVLAGAPAFLSADITSHIATAGKLSDIRSLGYVSEADKISLLSFADLFVYPSMYEGFGIPVLEAMHYGAPVLSSNSSSIPEVTGGAAVLTTPGDSEELHTRIDHILGDNIFREGLSQQGKARAAQFSWDKTAALTLDAYADAYANLS